MIANIPTTLPLPDVPVTWTPFLYAVSAVIVAVTGLIALWRKQVKIETRQGEMQDVQTTQVKNTQTLAAATLANTKAINATPGPNVPSEVEDATRAIRNDPTTATTTPCRTDPVPPSAPQVQT